MNPCPCGHLGDPTASCRCTAEQVARYQARISGPLLDRIDIQVQVPTQPPEVLLERQPPTEPASREIRRLVAAARARQQRRQGCSNAVLNNGELEKWCRLDNASRDFLARAMKSLGLSARAYHRILRVARTIADLAGEERIALPHLSEAVGYRRLV
jgi:magnesium chelatase family protein